MTDRIIRPWVGDQPNDPRSFALHYLGSKVIADDNCVYECVAILLDQDIITELHWKPFANTKVFAIIES